MRVERRAADGNGRQREGISQESQSDEDAARSEKQITRAVQQEEPERTPPIAKRSQMRGTRPPTVRMESDRHFGDARRPEARLHDHLRRELHPGAPLIQLVL